jgi:hypothetical protein
MSKERKPRLNADINVDSIMTDFKQYGDHAQSVTGHAQSVTGHAQSVTGHAQSVTGVTGVTGHGVAYPFIDALKTDVDDADIPLDTRVDLCIYKINQTMDNLPFLEFLLYMEGSEKEKDGRRLVFPYIFSRHTKSGLVEQCSPALVALFGHMDAVKYDGYVYEKSQHRCTLFFNEMHHTPLGGMPFMHANNRWFWTLSSEVFNERQMMNYTIADSVVDFFNRHPSIMLLKFNGRIVESPSALYAGKHFNYVAYMAEFGVKKASTRAHFGPYYYFVDFLGSMRYACYSMGFEPYVLDDGTVLTTNVHGKHTRGGVVRFAVFIGRCRAFFMNGDEDRSDLSMFWANKDPFVKSKLALRDINGNWTRSFNSAYVGEYELTINGKTKNRIPNWTIKDYDHQIPLSCHEIDMATVPNEYDPEFTNYKLA